MFGKELGMDAFMLSVNLWVVFPMGGLSHVCVRAYIGVACFAQASPTTIQQASCHRSDHPYCAVNIVTYCGRKLLH